MKDVNFLARQYLKPRDMTTNDRLTTSCEKLTSFSKGIVNSAYGASYQKPEKK